MIGYVVSAIYNISVLFFRAPLKSTKNQGTNIKKIFCLQIERVAGAQSAGHSTL
jgi:hypothetical protein